jgi:hypothetical protein
MCLWEEGKAALGAMSAPSVYVFSVFSAGLASHEGAEITGQRCSSELDSLVLIWIFLGSEERSSGRTITVPTLVS